MFAFAQSPRPETYSASGGQVDGETENSNGTNGGVVMYLVSGTRLVAIRRYLAGAVVSTPRDAATVALVRDGALGPEVYLIRRKAEMAFAGGMHVFVGGSVDSGDANIGRTWTGPTARHWASAFGCSEELAQMLVAAAARETFEESGVLFASTHDGRLVSSVTDPTWELERRQLAAGAFSFPDFLASRALLLRADLLRAWSNWVTPEWSPRRFNTRFFVAGVPDGQSTRDVGGEADEVGWYPISRAFAAFRGGALPMMMPTASTLRDLAAYDDVASILSAARNFAPVMLRPEVRGASIELVYDGPDGVASADTLVHPSH